MELACPHCRHVLEYQHERPLFCSFCGRPLHNGQTESTQDEGAATRAPSEAAGTPTETPSHVGGYRLRRELGGGGMGAVYEAEDAATGRRVAVKLISAEY